MMSTLNPYPQPRGPIAGGPAAIGEEELSRPDARKAFRSLKLLVSAYLGISLLGLVAIVLLRNSHTAVNAAVWTRGTIVALSALLTFTFTIRAARGSRRAYLRLRIISAVMVVAIAVIIALPGTFPLWMKVEQGISGLVLIGVAAIANGEHLRRLFAGRSQSRAGPALRHSRRRPGPAGPFPVPGTLDRRGRRRRAGQSG